MEFRIQRTEFLKGLRIAQNIADRKSTMPMLANVLLRSTGQTTLFVAATSPSAALSVFEHPTIPPSATATRLANNPLQLARRMFHTFH